MQNNKLLLKTNNLNLQNDLSKKINLPNLNKDSFKISSKKNGGIIVVKEGKTLASISLEIGGIIISRSSKEVISDLNNLHSSLKAISSKIDFNPFLTLSFLSLPVIPEIKITDKWLFDVTNFKFIPICE